jgi:hypothetical protein
MDWASSEELAEHFVLPWYMKMMRLNACDYGGDLVPEIAQVAVEADDDIVVRLLRLGWRERVMGAWLSVTRDSEKITNEVLRQLEKEAAQFLQNRFDAANPLPAPPDDTHQVFDTLLAVAEAIRGC